ncbi:recombinase family protein [Aminobacter sp. LjRoot7]|uniref:recombinase family protein n=1 Tax=Aminobacter sp. LjRoot7 TaxID=3342335 RepID=UPI003ECEFC62
MKALHAGDALVVWKLDRLDRDPRHLVNLVDDLTKPEIGLKVLAGEGVVDRHDDSKWPASVRAALAEFERALIVEREKAGLEAARARGRNGGRPFKMTSAKLRLARAAMGRPETKATDLCTELGITRQTLHHFVGPKGELRADGEKLLARRMAKASGPPFAL